MDSHGGGLFFFVHRQRAKLEAEARGVASVLIMFTAGVSEGFSLRAEPGRLGRACSPGVARA